MLGSNGVPLGPGPFAITDGAPFIMLLTHRLPYKSVLTPTVANAFVLRLSSYASGLFGFWPLIDSVPVKGWVVMLEFPTKLFLKNEEGPPGAPPPGPGGTPN
jgi:hypothetical protein